MALAACSAPAETTETYRVPAAQAFAAVSNINIRGNDGNERHPPEPADIETALDPGKSVTWRYLNCANERFRYVARFNPQGADETVVTIAFEPGSEPRDEFQKQRTLATIAESAAAAIEKRDFSDERVGRRLAGNFTSNLATREGFIGDAKGRAVVDRQSPSRITWRYMDLGRERFR